MNILNKINLLANLPRLKFRLNDYLTHEGIEFILRNEEYAEKARWEEFRKQTNTTFDDKLKDVDKGFYLKYKGLNSKIFELIQDYSNVSLIPFDMTDK